MLYPYIMSTRPCLVRTPFPSAAVHHHPRYSTPLPTPPPVRTHSHIRITILRFGSRIVPSSLPATDHAQRITAVSHATTQPMCHNCISSLGLWIVNSNRILSAFALSASSSHRPLPRPHDGSRHRIRCAVLPREICQMWFSTRSCAEVLYPDGQMSACRVRASTGTGGQP